MNALRLSLPALVTAAAMVGPGSACTRDPAAADRASDLVPARRAADMVHAALAADRQVYTEQIVQRLTLDQKVRLAPPEGGVPTPLEASEEWRSEHGKLPLPAQMFRMGAEKVLSASDGFSYLLLSEWPINRQNRARTPTEQRGLEQLTRSRKPSYASEELDGRRFFVAMYPDVAVAEACARCHNQHPDSPRRDFKVGDVMGALVIRFPMVE